MTETSPSALSQLPLLAYIYNRRQDWDGEGVGSSWERVIRLFCVFPPERGGPSPTSDPVKGASKESLGESGCIPGGETDTAFSIHVSELEKPIGPHQGVQWWVSERNWPWFPGVQVGYGAARICLERSLMVQCWLEPGEGLRWEGCGLYFQSSGTKSLSFLSSQWVSQTPTEEPSPERLVRKWISRRRGLHTRGTWKGLSQLDPQKHPVKARVSIWATASRRTHSHITLPVN